MGEWLATAHKPAPDSASLTAVNSHTQRVAPVCNACVTTHSATNGIFILAYCVCVATFTCNSLAVLHTMAPRHELFFVTSTIQMAKLPNRYELS